MSARTSVGATVWPRRMVGAFVRDNHRTGGRKRAGRLSKVARSASVLYGPCVTLVGRRRFRHRLLRSGADTLEWALVQAYQNNPSLNAQRAALRATDENVPQALSGYRPKLSVTGTGGYNYNNATPYYPLGGARTNSIQFGKDFYSRTVGATGTYTLFNGFQTANGPVRRKARSMPRARLCVSPSSRCCSMRPPPI